MTQAAAVEADELVPPLGITVATVARRYLVSPSPWGARDVGRCLTLASAGAIGILAAWYGAGGETELNAQVPWILGSLVALAVFTLAAVSWITTGMREVRHSIRDLAVDKDTVFQLARAVARDAVAHVSEQRVSGPDMTLAHRADCLLVRGKQVSAVMAHDSTRLKDCGVCLP